MVILNLSVVVTGFFAKQAFQYKGTEIGRNVKWHIYPYRHKELYGRLSHIGS